eukprot:7382901-Prymnesium_polylepis.3
MALRSVRPRDSITTVGRVYGHHPHTQQTHNKQRCADVCVCVWVAVGARFCRPSTWACGARRVDDGYVCASRATARTPDCLAYSVRARPHFPKRGVRVPSRALAVNTH